jgi:DNA-binding NarL/FixJ family response regulator
MYDEKLINIVIADDHDVYRRGVKLFINDTIGLKVTEEFNCGNALLNSANLEKNDLLILDISMPDISGIEILKILKERKINIKTIILSMHNSLPVIKKAYEHGANSYVLKSSSPQEIIKAIKDVHRNDFYTSNYE